MSRTTTPEDFNEFCKAMKDEKIQVLRDPQKRAIAFITQFARVYHVEKKLPSNLSYMILN